MTGDDRRSDASYDEARVPTPLRERVEELFVEVRGYEPATFQESLSVVTDLAAARIDEVDADAAPAADVTSDQPAESTARSSEHSTDASSDAEASGSASGPSPTTAQDLSDRSSDDESVRLDEYVGEFEGTDVEPSPAVESMLDTEHADGVVRELAAEVLDEMTDDAFQELEHGVDQGVAGVTDGMGATDVEGGTTAPSGSVGDGVPESLTADPETECAVCGHSHPVSVLQTTILDEDGSVALVCPSCSE